MVAVLQPLYFSAAPEEEFTRQCAGLSELLAGEATLLPPLPLDAALPACDAVLFPQLVGEAYRRARELGAIARPRLVITSEFGTMAMWDWELVSYLHSEGVEMLAPYTLEQARLLCRALSVKAKLAQSRLLVFQDNPGAGFQASIFKRFYWWEDECSARMLERYGVRVEKRSFRSLGDAARAIPDAQADAVLAARPFAAQGTSLHSLRSAVKLYLAVKQEMAGRDDFAAVGINCLNESHFSDTTPCLAWNLLYEEEGLIWGCEADTVSMLTKHILHRALGAPIMMTNLYPFLMGQAALKHERISDFPDLPEPENCVLTAHCGYLGVLPRPFASEWTLRPKVLAIVDENATAIDARLPEGPMTLAKLKATLADMAVVEGSLESYAQYPGSDCRNGAVLRVPDGRRLMAELPSHHALLLTGHHRSAIEWVGKVFNFAVQVL